MKVRNGFVSNSSSSSFVIHRSELGDSPLEEILKLYEDATESWNDMGICYEEENDYLHIGTHYAPPDVLAEIRILRNKNKGMRIDG